MNNSLTLRRIQQQIVLLRGLRVMLDNDLAKLYGVKTKAFNQAVKRNAERFPEDFMFRLTIQEFDQVKGHVGKAGLRSHNVTSNARGGRRYLPYAFTEQGVAMLSSVLNSKRAIQTNIVIMRAFVQLRQLAATHKRLGAKLAELERTVTSHDGHIDQLFEAIRQLMEPPASSSRRIGFREKEEN